MVKVADMKFCVCSNVVYAISIMIFKSSIGKHKILSLRLLFTQHAKCFIYDVFRNKSEENIYS